MFSFYEYLIHSMIWFKKESKRKKLTYNLYEKIVTGYQCSATWPEVWAPISSGSGFDPIHTEES